MTIGELEAALDMPRANIRFYEQEGFIHPRRGANNYRDYTEEDADTLRKVKLLRQLGLSLEEIRQAQRGERPLAALLGEQEAALAKDFIFELSHAVDEGHNCIRFCTSWSTRDEEVAALIEAIGRLN